MIVYQRFFYSLKSRDTLLPEGDQLGVVGHNGVNKLLVGVTVC